jgi:hypothetical protein
MSGTDQGLTSHRAFRLSWTLVALIALLLPAVAAAQPSPTFTNLNVSGAASFNGTGAVKLPAGTTAQQPDTGNVGETRYNSTTGRYEFGIGGSWINHVRLNGDTMTGALHLGANLLDGSNVSFTGGTLTGITLAGTIPGSPTLSGNPIFSGTLKVGAGGSGNAAMAQNGTGNWTVTLGGASSILNFRDSSSNSILQLGGASDNIAAKTQLQLSPAGVWSGSANSANSMFFHNGTWSGTATGAAAISLAFLKTTDTIDASTTDSLTLFTANMSAGGAAKGNRHAGLFTFQYTSTMASAGSNDTYTAFNTKAIASANDGGTGTTAATASGQLFATNPVCTLQSGATNWSSCIGTEIDSDVESGSSVMDKIGLQIVQVTADTVAGARDDVALSFNNQPSAIGWSSLIGIGRQGGQSPLSATGWVMQFTPHLGVGTISGGGGIDFTNFVPTTAFIRANNYLLDPSGNETVHKIVVSAMPANCTAQPTGTIWNNAGVANVCP